MPNFSEQFRAAAARIAAHNEKVAEAIVVGVGQSLIDKSPYGEPERWQTAVPSENYQPGQFRGSWHHSFNSPSEDFTSRVDASGEISMDEIRHGAQQESVSRHYITNNIGYAQEMERGGAIRAREVQPVAHAMVGLTQVEFPQIVRKAVQETKA